jgi:hypothetical protein
MKHIFTAPFSKRTNREVKTIRRPVSVKIYQDVLSEQLYSFTDVEVVKFNRNRKLELFFDVYQCENRYSLIEYVLVYDENQKIDRFFFSLKKALKENGSELLGYINLIDIGQNMKVHHHITIAIPKIYLKGESFPKHLKRTFNGKKIYSSIVRSRKKLLNYYLPKDIVELGIRKRTFGKSHQYKEIPLLIQSKKCINVS